MRDFGSAAVLLLPPSISCAWYSELAADDAIIPNSSPPFFNTSSDQSFASRSHCKTSLSFSPLFPKEPGENPFYFVEPFSLQLVPS
jgi:hypothetical protein